MGRIWENVRRGVVLPAACRGIVVGSGHILKLKDGAVGVADGFKDLFA